MKASSLVIMILLLVAVIVLAWSNSSLVTINYIIGSHILPLSVLLFIVLLIGIVMGLLFSLILLMKDKRTERPAAKPIKSSLPSGE